MAAANRLTALVWGVCAVLCCRYVSEPLPDGTKEEKVLPPFEPKKSKGLLDSLLGRN
jgi:hypothetical protein